MTVYERIQAGHYKTKKLWPTATASIKAIDARRMREEYRADDNRLTELFWSDLADEFRIAKTDPFFIEFRRICCGQGHSSGLSEVYNFATEYRTLVDLYLAKIPSYMQPITAEGLAGDLFETTKIRKKK